MKKFTVCLLALAVIAPAILAGEENEAPVLEKITIEGNIVTHGSVRLNSMAEIETVIRSISDAEANRHLDTRGTLGAIGLIGTIGGGAVGLGAFAVGLANIGSGNSATFIVGAAGLGVMVVGVVFGLLSPGHFYAAIDRYNAVVDERTTAAVSLVPAGNGMGIRISF